MRKTITMLALLTSACGGSRAVNDETQSSMSAGEEQAEYVSGDSAMEEGIETDAMATTEAPVDEAAMNMTAEVPAEPEPVEQLVFRGPDGSEVEVREVVLRKARNGDQHLIFFRETVDCSALNRLPTRRDEAFVAMTQLPEQEGAREAGPLPRSQWTMRVGTRTRTARGEEGWVRITNGEATDSVAGEVAIQTEIQGDAVALSGPFQARVCDLAAPSEPVANNAQPQQAGSIPAQTGSQEAEGTSQTQ
jgi:hypothetical protein